MVSISFFFRSNARRSALRVLSTALLVTASIGLVAGCSTGGSDPDLPTGSWDDGFGNVYTITETTVSYADTYGGSYSARIVFVDDSRLNGGDTSVTAGGDDAVNPGHVVIRYTSVSDASWGEVNKYNIFRWADGADAHEKVMTQGGKYEGNWGDPDYRMVVFESSTGARIGATNDAGFFAYAGTVTKQ